MNAKVTSVAEPIERMLEQLSVDAVFGRPIKEGDVIVIPVAEISTGFGYGDASSRPSSNAAEGDQKTAGESGVTGAGGGGRATPRGYIQITPEGIKFEPIMDPARIVLAGIAMGAWSVFWIAKTIRTFTKASVKKEL